MANTSWSTTDKTAGVTLSNANLTATSTALGFQAVRTVDNQIATKLYCEFTFTNTSNASAGFANGMAALGSGTAPNTVTVASSGAVSAGSVGLGSVGSFATNGIAGCALDLVNELIFVRNGAAGNWNGSATANPTTGIGGWSVAGVFSGGLAAYGLMLGTNSTTGAITANFGDSAFAGVVPSGYTSGFTAGAVLPLNEILTQIVMEVWGASNPAAMVTQTALEVWGTPNTWLAESGIVRETLLSTPGYLRTAGLVREVLRSSGTGAGTFLAVDGLIREVLRSSAATGGGGGGSKAFAVVMG